MNICITPDSIKLFGAYINKRLPEQLTKEKTAEALLNDLFNDALAIFSDNGMTKTRNKELILQHMSIVPQIVLKHIADNPKLGKPASSEKFQELANEVISAIEDKTTKSFQDVVNKFGGYLGNQTIIATVGNPTDRFEAVSFELNKTNNQEAIYDEESGYSENFLDPAKQFEFSVVRNTIKSDNNLSYRFRVATLSEVLDNPALKNTTGSEDPNLPVLLLVDINNNILKFDGNGVVTKDNTGFIPVYTVKTDKNSLKYQENSLTKKAKFNNPSLTDAQARTIARKQVSDFIEFMNSSVSSMKSGDTVFMNLDMAASSLGFIAQNRNKTTDLNKFEGELNLIQGGTSGSFYPVIAVENTNKSYRVFEKALSTLTDEEFEALHHLISADKISISRSSIETSNKKGTRETFINFFIDSYKPGNFYYYVEKSEDKNIPDKRMVRLGGPDVLPILASEVTLSQLKDFANKRWAKPVNESTMNPDEVKPKASINDVTNLGEYYYGEDGKVYESVGVRRSFRNRIDSTMDTKIFETVVGFKDGTVIKGDNPISLRTHVINVGYTNLVPTGENKLTGVGAYLAFKPGMVSKQDEKLDNINDEDDFKWRSIPERNTATKATAEQDEKALAWWNSDANKLRPVVNLSFENAVSEYGPNFVANFLGDSITLFKGSSYSDIYHEAFHAYFIGILNSADRTEIYSTLRKTPGYFTTVIKGKSKVVAYSDATDLELEEFLAEGFREYALTDGKKTNFSDNKILAFFQKLLNLLKSVFGNMTYAEAKALNKTHALSDIMFSDLFKGNFTSDMFVASNEEAKWMSSEIETTTGDTFTLEEMYLTMSSMKSILSEFVSTGLNISANKEDKTRAVNLMARMAKHPQSSEEYKALADELQILEDSTIRSGNGIFELGSNPELLQVAVNYIKVRLTQEYNHTVSKLNAVKAIENPTQRQNSESRSLEFHKQLLEKIIKPENFGALTDLNKKVESDEELVNTTLLPVFLNSYSNLGLKNTQYEDKYDRLASEEEVYVSEWDKTGNDELLDDLLDEHTKSILDSVHAYTEQGKGVAKLNPLGFKEMLPYKNALAKVAKLLRNTPDAMEMCKKLKAAAKTDKEVDQIFRKLGDISDVSFAENMTTMEHKQWSAFWQTFNKADVLLREFILEKNVDDTNISGPIVTLTSKSGKSSSMSLQVARNWAANFKFKLATSDYAEEINGTPVINLENLFLDYNHVDRKTGVATLFYAKITGTDKDFYKSRNEISNKSEYTLTPLPAALSKPFDFLSEFGIDLVNDADVRRILFNGDKDANIDAGIIKYINNSISNRLNKVIFFDGKYILDPNRFYITKLDDIFTTFEYFDEDGKKQLQPDLFGYKNQLRELQYVYSNEYTDFSSYNANNKIQSEKSFNSSLLLAASALNLSDSLEELLAKKGMEDFNPATNPEVASCKWFIDMFQLDPTVTDVTRRGKRDWSVKITVDNLSGSKLISKYSGYEEEVNKETGDVIETKINNEYDNGIEAINSDFKTKLISDFHLTLEGKQEVPRSEAKSTSVSVYAATKKGSDVRKGFNLRVNKSEIETIFNEKYDFKAEILYNEFKNHIAAEIIRIQKVKRLKAMILSGEIDTTDLAIDVAQLNRGAEWHMFDKIFGKTLKNNLEKFKIDSIIGEKAFNIDGLSKPLKKSIEQALVKYFKKEAELLQTETDKKLVISDTLSLYYTNKDKEESASDIRTKMYRAFVINNFVQNANYTALFIGDPSMHDVEGEAYHKRIAGLISTGKIFREDDVWLRYLNSEKYNSHGFAKKHNAANGIVKDYSYNGYLNTAILKEVRSNSVYAKHYRELFPDIDTAEYDKDGPGAMKEADGQGWISFDAYRILNDSIGEWSDEQERLYQKMLSGEKLTAADYATTFPVRKFQYYGMVSNPESKAKLEAMGLSFNNLAFHKYSLVPLIPALIEGSPLEDLHNKMMEQGIDYATMESGSKLTSLSKVAVENGEVVAKFDDFYDSNSRGTTNADPDFKFTPNVIHVKYLKSQIFLAEGYKGHVTLPTQLRKIVTLGIMNGGVPTDFVNKGKGTDKEVWDALSPAQKLKQSKNWTWLTKFTNTLEEMEEVLKDQLLEDIELKETTVNGKKQYTGDSSKLAKYLKEKLKSKELLPEEIAYITKPDGTLIDDLSLSMISEKLEEILVTLVDKTLRRITVNGEALVQVSGSMYESKFKKPNPEQLEKFGNNGLKTYYLKDKFGNPVIDINGDAVVQAMEVKISLQGDFKKLLYTKHSDGDTMAVFTKTEDGKREMDMTESLKRLNESIKDPIWLKEHGKLISLPGVRIPTQGPNALVAATVAEFLPEWAGPIIILPSEIVAQTGADYDIDKLFQLFKNILLVNNKVEQVKYIKNVPESFDELSAKIVSVNSQQKDAKKDISSAWEEYTKYLEEKTSMNTETNDLFATINALREDLDKLYAYKKDVWQNKNYKKSDKYKIYDEIDSEIDFINMSISELNSVAQTDLSNFFDKEIKSKTDRAAAVRDKYDFYMDNIRNAEKVLSDLNDQELELRRKVAGKGTKGLQNDLADLISERILMPENLQRLVTPNTTKNVEPLARAAGKKISKSFDKLANKNESTSKADKISRTSIYEYRYNLSKHQENSVGRDALGIAAIASTFYAIFTTFGATLQDTSAKDQAEFEKALQTLQNASNQNSIGYDTALKTIDKFNNKKLNFVTDTGEIGYNLNEKANAVTLGLIKNTDGKEISDIISQLINGYVDVAKDAWIFDAQGTKENTPTLLLLVMAGVSTDAIISMVNNPLVLEYNTNKKELSGVFANLTNEFAKEESKNKLDAVLDTVFENHKELFTSSNPDNKLKVTTLNYNLIANTAQPFSNSELNSRLGAKPTFRDVEILSHYLQIEKIADELNTFTQLSKFDTVKISSISEAQNRIEDIVEFKNQKIENKIVPDNWFTELDNSPVGKFNHDDFIIELFSNYFKIKNNKALILRSLGIKAPKGTDRKKVMADFKNDFMWFLYQNAVYNTQSYTTSPTEYVAGKIAKPGKTYTFNEDANMKSALEINEETGEVRYSPFAKVYDNNMLEFMYSSKFFKPDQPRAWVSFLLEYNNLKDVSKDLTDNEFKEAYYQFDNPANSFLNNGSAQGRNIILQRAALYHSNNIDAMFDLSVGVGFVIKNMIAKYPDLQDYAVIRDMGFDFNEEIKKMNIFFPQIKDPQLASIYREDVGALKNHPEREVAELFGKFTHIGIMQFGMNRSSKYDFSKITEQGLFSQVIESEIGLTYINDALDTLSKQFEDREQRKDGQIIDQFKNIYLDKIKGNGMRIKVRGTNYNVNKLKFSYSKSKKETAIAYSNVVIIPLDKALTPEQNILEVSYFYDNHNVSPIQFAESIKDMQWVIRNKKLLAPEGKSQKKLDDALLVLGIVNSNDLPATRYKSKNVKKGFLSIAGSDVQKGTYYIKDDAMANSSTKAIGKETAAFNPKYDSSTKAYAAALERDHPGTLAKAKSKKEQFVPTDKVWVFGSTITENAYKGKTKEEFIANVNKTFEDYHKPLIDKALEAGVKTFFVGNATGIDTMAVNYLKTKDFQAVLRYTSAGTYFEVVPIDAVDKVDAVNFVPSELEFRTKTNPITNALFDELYDGDPQYLKTPKWFADLKPEEIYEKGLKKTEDAVKQAVAKLDKSYSSKASVGYRALFINLLDTIGNGRIVVGNSMFDSMVEQVLMKFRQAVINSHAKLNKQGDKQLSPAAQLYADLGKDTQSVNVVLPSDLEDNTTYTGKNFWNDILPEARQLFGNKINRKTGKLELLIIAYRGNSKKSFLQNYRDGMTVGNPFDWQQESGSRDDAGKVSTIKFIHWMTTGENLGNANATEEYRQAIINDIVSGKIKGSSILYYQEKGYATHATALDYLINKYDWSASSTQPSATEKNLRTTAPVLTFNLLPFTEEEKANILTNFTKKHKTKFVSQLAAKKHIDEALAQADEQKQKEIIELLKECYK
jgi:hypothetical protein